MNNVVIFIMFFILILLNLRFLDNLQNVKKKLDDVVNSFEGLREYLYEIDPQFEDERESQKDFDEGKYILAGMDALNLEIEKKGAGKRTLSTSFLKRDI
jgi:hypothetical protein